MFNGPEYIPQDGLNPDDNPVAAKRALVIAAADVNDVMRDQLEYLIVHAERGTCGCLHCQRYLRARSLLTELFSDS